MCNLVATFIKFYSLNFFYINLWHYLPSYNQSEPILKLDDCTIMQFFLQYDFVETTKKAASSAVDKVKEQTKKSDL